MSENIVDTLILVGCKSCGKSTQGKALADHYKTDFYDVDNVIEEMCGISPRELYAKKGVIEFMLAEEKACEKILKDCGEKRVVISTGGGICDNAPALCHLKGKGRFVFLKIDVQNSVDRIMSRIEGTDPDSFTNVPAYIAVKKPQTLDEIRSMLTERFQNRTTMYENIADVVVDIKNAPQEENFNSILGAL